MRGYSDMMPITLCSHDAPKKRITPFPIQLLKWVGNKQRFAHEIIRYFPDKFNTYFEPFLGSGAVLATLSPKNAFASDIFPPLIEIFKTLQSDPDTIKKWYRERWEIAHGENKKEGYYKIRESYNKKNNGADFLFLSRSCYGGVVRYRKKDGYMSTPCGAHEPLSPSNFDKRVDAWHERVKHTRFELMDYKSAMRMTKKGDLVYCDPPYKHSQSILYGGQDFDIEELFIEIDKCKRRGVYVALSIDGMKKSGNVICDIPMPKNLFEKVVYVNTGKSMLKRFQMGGKTLYGEEVVDRLLLTYKI